MITFEEFKKLEIRVGKIILAEKVEGADKLLKLQIDLGSSQPQVVAGIAQYYQPEQLVGKEVVVLVNLEPRTIRGVESQGMMLAADVEGRPYLLQPDTDIPSGTPVH